MEAPLLEYKKNSNLIKILFKMKDTEKMVINIANLLMKLRVLDPSLQIHRDCLTNYNEGSCYYFQCCGFLKSQYFGSSVTNTSKEFLIKNLLTPAYKRFLMLNKNLSILQVEPLHNINLKALKEKVEQINISLFELQKELTRIE
jgi:hypothetical protein